MKDIKQICVVGLGYVGMVLLAVPHDSLLELASKRIPKTAELINLGEL